jgi:nitrogen regulatory protein PII
MYYDRLLKKLIMMFVKDEVVDEVIKSIFRYTKWWIMDAEMILIDQLQ